MSFQPLTRTMVIAAADGARVFLPSGKVIGAQSRPAGTAASAATAQPDTRIIVATADPAASAWAFGTYSGKAANEVATVELSNKSAFIRTITFFSNIVSTVTIHSPTINVATPTAVIYTMTQTATPGSAGFALGVPITLNHVVTGGFMVRVQTAGVDFAIEYDILPS